MKEKKYTCNICGRQHSELDAYIKCVSECGKKAKENEKRNEEINAAINRVKQAEKYLQEQKNFFKEKFPEEYDLNFSTKVDKKVTPKVNSVEFSYEKNEAEDPTVITKINGEEVTHDAYKTLLESDPNTKYIAQLLGLLTD